MIYLEVVVLKKFWFLLGLFSVFFVVGVVHSGVAFSDVYSIVLDDIWTNNKVSLLSFKGKPIVLNFWAYT